MTAHLPVAPLLLYSVLFAFLLQPLVVTQPRSVPLALIFPDHLRTTVNMSHYGYH